jgi:XTP/dITP diphosphohydrolase
MKPSLEKKLVFFVTTNIHKFKEAREILTKQGIAIAMIKMKAIEIQEEDLEEIAKASVLDATKKCRLPVIVEDAGLFIKSLNGFPGPYSSYVYKTLGVEGVLKLMENVGDKEAEFRSVVAYCEPKTNILKTFCGRVKGRITEKPSGSSGFGFDPIFQPLETSDQKTFAEMSIEEKNQYSHRAKALNAFAEWFLHGR